MKKIYIATSSFGVIDKTPLKLIEEFSYKVLLNNKKRKLKSSEIVDELIDCDGVIAGTEQYDKGILSELDKLKVISRLGVGLDNIDLNFASKRGIKVLSTKTSPALSVSELSLGLMLGLFRKICKNNDNIINGIWQKNMGTLLHGKTLGIVGLGAIGKQLVQLVKGFNFNLLAYDENQDKQFAKKNNVQYCSIDELVSSSDIISIHLNLSDKTTKFMDKNKLNKMKTDAIVINTSRGEIIDEDVLYQLLKDKKILGAGLDVYQNEPYKGKLVTLDNVILTPHIGAYTKEVRVQMEKESAQNLIEALNVKK